MNQSAENESKLIAMGCYVHWVGWIVAFVVSRVCGTQSELASFHLRQSFGVQLLMGLLYIAVGRVWTLSQIIAIVWTAYAALGVYAAYHSRLIYAPLFGKLVDRLFRFVR